MKRRCLLLTAALALVLSACSLLGGKYKRVVLVPADSDEAGSAERRISLWADVEDQSSERYGDTLPIYQITPYAVTEQELVDFAAALGVQAPVQHDGEDMAITERKKSVTGKELVTRFAVSGNRVDYTTAGPTDCGEMQQSDAELEEEAKRVFASLPMIHGEYEFAGQKFVTSVSDSEGSYTVRKGYGFQPVLDGVRVTGENYCTLYFNANGLCEITMRLYSYERTGKMDLLSLDNAVKRIKKADAFTTDLEGQAKSLCIERTRLFFVNQYGNGCEILQPVYQLEGTATNEDDRAEFSAKIVAIPEKYTHD